MKFLVIVLCALISTITGAWAFFLIATQGTQSIVSSSISCGVSCSFNPGTASTVGTLTAVMAPVAPGFAGSWSIQVSGTVNGQTCDNSGSFSVDGSGNLNVSAAAFAGTYQVCYVATAQRVAGSPFVNVVAVASATGTFPISVSSSKRYLQTVTGRPFPIIADSAQALVGNVPLCQSSGTPSTVCTGPDPGWTATNSIANYLSTRASQGFNTIQLDVLCDSYVGCPSSGADVSGNSPFTSGTSPTNYLFGAAPCANCNPTYWNRIDAIIALAAQNNLFVLLNPTATENCGTGSFWSTFSNPSNGGASGTGFGTFLGNRYKNTANVGWQHANDYSCWQTAADDLLISNIVSAIAAAGDTHIVTMEVGINNQTSLDDATQNPTHNWATLLSVNGAYTYYQPVVISTDPGLPYAYNQTPTMPAIDVEANYEGENGGGSAGCNGAQPPGPQACQNQIMRKQFWGIFTSGGVGDIYGAHCVWNFDPGTSSCAGGTGTGWPNYLALPGVQQFVFLKNFISQYNWQLLQPDLSHTFMTAGMGAACTGTLSACAFATAGVASDKSFALIYVPAAQNAITVAMSGLNNNISGLWYDPTTANTTFADTTCPSSTPCPNTGTKTFSRTALNSEGDATWSHDWVLVLTAGPPPPPTISNVVLSNGNNFITPANPGSTIDTLTASCSVGSCAGATFSFSTAAPSCSSATSNGLFALSGSNLNIGASTVNAGNYAIGIAVTLTGATNSGVCFPFTLVGAGQSITAVSLSNSTFAGGAPSGTVVGSIGVTVTPSSPAFSGTLSVTGTNASSFQIVGTNLETNGVVPNGTYNINIVATQAGLSGSPFTQAETITGQSSVAEKPGISAAWFSSPYYTCNTNFYVGNFGSGTPSDSNNGTSQSTPWATLTHANTVDITTNHTTAGSWCVNVAPATYATGPADGPTNGMGFGGNTASSTGYVVWRCTGNGNETNTSANQCTITDRITPFCSGVTNGCTASPGTFRNYIIIDNFNFAATPAQNGNSAAISCWNSDIGPTAACHHWIVVNNIINGYGQSGVSWSNSDYGFALHNIVNNNSGASGCNGGSQGSGLAYTAILPVAGSYVQTADDMGSGTNAAKLGIYMNTAPNPNPIHNYLMYNVIYNNFTVGCSPSTDGNGIIMDTNDNSSTGVNYALYSLNAFNVVYNNGGAGLKSQHSSYDIFANNSCFNSYISPQISQTWAGCIWIDHFQDTVLPGQNILVNNVSYQPSPFSGTIWTPFFVGGTSATQGGVDAYYNGGTSCGGPTIGGKLQCGGNNVSFQVGGTAPEAIIANVPPDPQWSCTGNKCMADGASTPFWTNVDSSGGKTGAIGSQSTQPVGTNFAVPTASPARGYVITQPYLPSWTQDAGACDRSFTTCP